MAQTCFPITNSIIAAMQSASVLPPRFTNQSSPSVIAALSCVEEQYIVEHSRMMRCVAGLRNAWIAMGGAPLSDQLHAASGHSESESFADAMSHSAPVGSINSHAERMRELEAQVVSLKAYIQNLELQHSSMMTALSQSSFNDLRDASGSSFQKPTAPSALPFVDFSGEKFASTTVLNCKAAVTAGIRRRSTVFLNDVFDRYKDENGSLAASKLIVALKEADALVIPDSEAAAATTIARFDSNSNGLMEFSEFERAVNVSDELSLYFQEKRQPALGDALRAIVGRGSDQLLLVSQLSPEDMFAACTAVCALLPEQAKVLHEELQRSFAAQFDIQSQMAAEGSKFNVVKMACGGVEDFHSGLTGRVGMPNLKFKEAMKQEHCERAGCNTSFSTGNYNITTTPRQEWSYIVGNKAGKQVACPASQMGHGRRIVPLGEMMELKLTKDAKLTEVEVYNCILRRFPADKYTLFHEGGNLYATTIFVLVSAVQKISRCTRIPEGTLLYRGLGGLLDLPDKFHAADEQGRSGYLDWGMMSTSSDRNVALGYSGMKQRRPRAMVMVIEATSVDRGADISEFSQYPGEKEFLWVPCSFVQRAQPGGGRVEVVDGGLVTFVPVRVNLNLKTETVEELLEKKKSMHVTAFEFRVNELRQRLLDEAKAGNAEARLKNDKDDQGEYWEQEHSVQGYIEAQVAKVAAVLEKHRAREANDYSDDVVYRNLAAESLEAASMAQSALQLWLRDKLQNIDFIYDCSLLDLHRRFESFMKLRYTSADAQEDRSAAAVELCKVRNLMISDANEKDGNGEPLLVALAARGASGEDVELLIAAGADMSAVSDEYNESAIHLAGQQGHAEVIRTLVRAGANYNQTSRNGSTPLWLSSFSGQLGSVKVLLEAKADVDQARTDEGGTPLSIACQQGHVSIVEALLGQRADMNKARTEDGVSPLFLACEEGHDSIVEALLCQKADVNQARTEDGSTPLLIACQEGHDSIVEALLGHRADVNKASTDDGSTPLHAACEEGHDSIVEALLGHRADVNQARTDDGSTPLHVACEEGHASIVKALIGQRAGVNQARTDDGSTPLYTACENHHTSCVRLLLHARADPALSCEGKAPLALALEKGFADIAATIEKGIA